MQRLKIINWNVRKAKSNSPAWDIIMQADADVVTLQEVAGIPDFVKDRYKVHQKQTVSKSGIEQKFATAILAKGDISDDLYLQSDFEWVNKELTHFSGNLLACQVKMEGFAPIHVVSVYSPAWPIPVTRLEGIDIAPIKLKQNPGQDIWCSEILWSALCTIPDLANEYWLVAGDFNSSTTFDLKRPRGNQEIIDRMNALGLTECLFSYTKKLTPTFKNACGGKVIHQLDHMYVSDMLHKALISTYIGDAEHIFGNSISDHVPIISEFNFKTPGHSLACDFDQMDRSESVRIYLEK